MRAAELDSSASGKEPTHGLKPFRVPSHTVRPVWLPLGSTHVATNPSGEFGQRRKSERRVRRWPWSGVVS